MLEIKMFESGKLNGKLLVDFYYKVLHQEKGENNCLSL